MAIGVAAAALLVIPPRYRFGTAEPVDTQLAPFLKANVRWIEPRLSGGFPWKPFRSDRHILAREEGVFASAIKAGEPILRGEGVNIGHHTNGVVLLLGGQIRQAVAILAQAAASSKTPAAWNDVGVAYHEAAVRYDAPELLPDALTATDHALALDPHQPEALFNRALMLERLGLRTDARKAWVQYLGVDPESAWANEARTHLRALRVEKPFMDRLDGQYDLIATDAAAAKALYETDPFNARGQTLMQVLGRWGDAVQHDDDGFADRHLRVARNLGAAVTDGGGDRTLERAVAAIDAATGKTRWILAAAHVDYRDGLQAFQAGLPVTAEPLLRRAAEGFKRANSAAMLPALFFAANTVYEQGRHGEAEQQIKALLASEPDSPAYRAFMHWQLGICHRSRADWGASIAHFEKSAALFESLGETQNVTTVRRLLAFVYDRIGDVEAGWRNRTAALRGGRGSSSPLVHEKTVSSIAEAALLRKQWDTAESFLTLHAEISRRIKDDVLLMEALLLRAVVRDHTGNKDGVRADVVEAQMVAARIQDPTYRKSAHVVSLRAMATLSTTPPSVAESLLTEAIELRDTESDPASLPGLLLQRARARRSRGDLAGAQADIGYGIAELERNRESIPEGEERWGAFHGAEELFEEGIDLTLANRDVEGALRIAEQARARALLDSYGRSPDVGHHRLPPNTVVVEYVSLPERLVIFTVSNAGIRAHSVTYPRQALIRDVTWLTHSVSTSISIQGNTAAGSMYERLIAPVDSQFSTESTIVFVPDAVMATVPFGALLDRSGVPLLQRHTLANAGSVAAFIAASEQRLGRQPPRNALLISASEANADLTGLPRVGLEVAGIATAYARTTRVHISADWADAMRHASAADVIHFAGHGVGDDRGFEPASIVVHQSGRSRRIAAGEIAKLDLAHSPTVVLAGCSTARGQQRATEGVISVAHGFLSAGAPSVIATLWPIDDDAASRFFPRLHRRLAQGMSPAEALRATQLESITRGDVPASLWAAVQNIGS